MRGVSIITASGGGNRNAERITKGMDFFRLSFASSQEISLSNSLTSSHTLEVILQTFLYGCDLRHLQSLLHKDGNNFFHGNPGRIHPQIMAVLRTELSFVKNVP